MVTNPAEAVAEAQSQLSHPQPAEATLAATLEAISPAAVPASAKALGTQAAQLATPIAHPRPRAIHAIEIATKETWPPIEPEVTNSWVEGAEVRADLVR